MFYSSVISDDGVQAITANPNTYIAAVDIFTHHMLCPDSFGLMLSASFAGWFGATSSVREYRSSGRRGLYSRAAIFCMLLSGDVAVFMSQEIPDIPGHLE